MEDGKGGDKQILIFFRPDVVNVFVGTHGVSEPFDVQDLSPQLGNARGMALDSVGHPFLSGCRRLSLRQPRVSNHRMEKEVVKEVPRKVLYRGFRSNG